MDKRPPMNRYVKSKVERFEGRLSGALYAYEYVTVGKATQYLSIICTPTTASAIELNLRDRQINCRL